MGYAYGYLLSEEVSANYFSLLSSLLSNNSSLDKVRPNTLCYCCGDILPLPFQGLELVIGLALDWQWNDYLVCWHISLSACMCIVLQSSLAGFSYRGRGEQCSMASETNIPWKAHKNDCRG